MANAAANHGPEMGARLEEIRGCEADVQVNAANAASLNAENLGLLADNLANAASLAQHAGRRNTNMQAGEMVPKPDLHALEQSITAFRNAMVRESRA